MALLFYLTIFLNSAVEDGSVPSGGVRSRQLGWTFEAQWVCLHYRAMNVVFPLHRDEVSNKRAGDGLQMVGDVELGQFLMAIAHFVPSCPS